MGTGRSRRERFENFLVQHYTDSTSGVMNVKNGLSVMHRQTDVHQERQTDIREQIDRREN